jgi:hypothetical protein
LVSFRFSFLFPFSIADSPRPPFFYHPSDSIMQTLESGGNALLPVDTAGRVLELLLVLHQYWDAKKLGKRYPLALLRFD